jgi:pyruvate dehydrogenase E2 component (dihydrolipoamide acetyltransferase)
LASIEFRLPDVGEGIASAEIVEWRVAAGDQVREGQDLVEVQTDKAIVVIPCPTSGVVKWLGAPAGETLDTGAVLAVFESGSPEAAPREAGSPEAAPPESAPSESGSPESGSPEAARPESGSLEAAPSGSDAESPSAQPGQGAHEDPRARAGADRQGNGAGGASAPAVGHRSLAAPATRRLARELGVDLAEVRGSGPEGRIVREDVESAAAPLTAAATGPRPGQTLPLRGVRRTIARTLTRAWQEIPHMIDYREVDATNLIRLRRVLRQRATERGEEKLARALSPTPLILLAAVKALREHPYVNSSIDLERGEITLHEQINIGIATATPDGLMVPVLHDADRRSVSEIAIEVGELVAAARARRLAPKQLAGATFTVNNYGGLGIWLGTPIIRPPEVANLGVGAIRDRVVPIDGAPAVRPILVLAVSGDHRVLDADTLAAFVTKVVGLLEEPLLMLEDLR